MNQRNAAMGLASLGRGSDSSLVHMSPREIQALQQLAVQHGGSLTINPETGLPEAGFLSNLLPAIVGVGLAGVTGGASLGILGKMTALKAGLLMGGGALLASGGDWRQAAKWGLGGYGGASLGSGLAGAAPAAPVAAPTATAAAASANPASIIAKDLIAAKGGPAFAAQTPISGLAAETAVAQAPVTYGNMWKGFKNLGSEGAGAKFAAGVQGANPFGLGVKTAGLAALAPAYLQEPEEFEPVDVDGTEEVAYPAYAPLNRQALAVRDAPYSVEDSSEQDWFSEPAYRAYDPNVDPYNANYQSGVATAAQGGIVSLQEGGEVGEQDYFQDRDLFSGLNPTPGTPEYVAPPPSATANFESRIAKLEKGAWKPANLGQLMNRNAFDPANRSGGNPRLNDGELWAPGTPEYDRVYKQWTQPKNVLGSFADGVSYTSPKGQEMIRKLRGDDLDSFERTFAQPTEPAAGGDSGEQSYFNYAAGGLTAGPGDGMSDDIMTTIAGRQRAALSPGEFVVPADVVSGIGNGDTNSGAKRLYAMMDGIRDRRTGQTAQPQRINPRLPA
jgi:hypothetical protein